MGPYDVRYNDYGTSIEWTTESYPLYAYSLGGENDGLKVARTSSGTVYHAVSEKGNKEIWITHFTDGYANDTKTISERYLVKKEYPDESIDILGTHSDVDGHSAKNEISCNQVKSCFFLVAWILDDKTICEVNRFSETMLSSLHIKYELAN